MATRSRVPKAVQEFDASLDRDTVQETRAIAQELTPHQHTETRTMTTKRTPTTKKAEPTPVTKPEPKKGTTKKAAKPKAAKKAKATKPSDRTTMLAKYMQDKLRVQKQLKVGAVITYRGRNETIDGKQVKVTGHETRGGVFVEFKGERYVVSPHALLKK